MSTDSLIYATLRERLADLPPEDRRLLLNNVVIELTEDQTHPEDMAASLQAWLDLGFALSFDDTIGSYAREVLKLTKNFHTPEALLPLIDYFSYVKVDMDWAGHCIFLSHPALRPAMKAEVLRYAEHEDKLLVAKGPKLEDTGASYALILAEFARFCKDVFSAGRKLTIELTITEDDPNNAMALNKLKDLGVDVFGEHSSRFWFQGGPTGAKAFEPESLAGVAEAIE